MALNFDDVLAANKRYAETFQSQGVPGVAARGLAVICCMGSRIEPLKMLGLANGEAKILRNAGARFTDDALRTLVLAAHRLGVMRVMVVAHTDCRMSKVTDEQVHTSINERSGLDTQSLEFHTVLDQQAVLEVDVQRIRSSPYLPGDLAVTGAGYNVATGRIEVLVPA